MKNSIEQLTLEEINQIDDLILKGNTFLTLKTVMDLTGLDLKKANKYIVSRSKKMQLSFEDIDYYDQNCIDVEIKAGNEERAIALLKEVLFLGLEDATLAYYKRSNQLGFTKEVE